MNVPIGVIGFVLAVWLVPDWQPSNSHRFDIRGSCCAAWVCWRLVFGIQNGQQYDWGTVAGPLSIPVIIGAGRGAAGRVRAGGRHATGASRCCR